MIGSIHPHLDLVVELERQSASRHSRLSNRITELESELQTLKNSLARMLDHAKGPVRCDNESDIRKLEYRADDLERDGISMQSAIDYIEGHLVL